MRGAMPPTARSRYAGGVSSPGDRVGLCLRCIHAHRVPSRTSVFWRCGLAESDARYVRYPRLPVIKCAGFEAAPRLGGQDNGPDGEPPGP